MIDIPAALQAKLEAGVTTLAWCWVLTRRDGAVFGFTDHDRPLSAAGTLCQPGSGLAAGDTRAETESAPARGAVFGALNAAAITDADLDNGLWDAAQVEVYRVDWSEPALMFKTFTGELGAISRGASGFEAEVSGLSARLNRTIGRVFSRRCDAELGDARCGIDLSAPGRQTTVSVVQSPAPGALEVDGGHALPGSDLEWGVADWLTGPNAGGRARILAHRAGAGRTVIELDPAPAKPPGAGDALRLSVGCDKRFETCRDRFSNAVNFRGCPHLPGNDMVLRAAGSEPVRDGGAR